MRTDPSATLHALTYMRAIHGSEISMQRRIILNPVLIDNDAEFESWLESSLAKGMPLGRVLEITAQRDARLRLDQAKAV
jgi:hypothetical protein